MSRFKILWIPRCSWQAGVEECDQRWTETPNVFSGTAAEATIECSDLESAYDRNAIFRAVLLPVTPEEEQHHFCATCGGDFRERISHPLACSCPVAIAGPRSTRWIKPGEEKAS